MSFNTLNIVAPILDALHAKGYTQPTPIQLQAIPAMLSGKDVLASAQTGTGKTASYSIPMLQLLAAKGSRRGIKGLVLAPTRELAVQVAENLTQYGKKLSISNTLVYGGVSQVNQVKDLRRGVDIFI
jgi:ATP-dependent RNA helicase RhlE